MVRVGSSSYPVTVEENETGISLMMEGREIELETDWEVGEAMMNASVDGNDVTVHVREQKRRGKQFFVLTFLFTFLLV